MFTLHRPTDAQIARLLENEAALPYSYADVGVTRGSQPTRLARTHHRARLGTGQAAYAAAVVALRRWAMYDLTWVEVFPAATPVREGSVFATLVRHLGFWSTNPCRVVYVEEHDGDARMDAFAIGSLPGHAERGEERFQVAWDRADGTVWFEIVAFSGPRHWMARLGTPVVRHLQHRFGTQALAAMQAAVAAEGRTRGAPEPPGISPLP